MCSFSSTFWIVKNVTSFFLFLFEIFGERGGSRWKGMKDSGGESGRKRGLRDAPVDPPIGDGTSIPSSPRVACTCRTLRRLSPVAADTLSARSPRFSPKVAEFSCPKCCSSYTSSSFTRHPLSLSLSLSLAFERSAHSRVYRACG